MLTCLVEKAAEVQYVETSRIVCSTASLGSIQYYFILLQSSSMLRPLEYVVWTGPQPPWGVFSILLYYYSLVVC